MTGVTYEAACAVTTWAQFDAIEEEYQAARKACSAAVRARGPRTYSVRLLRLAADLAHDEERRLNNCVRAAWIAAMASVGSSGATLAYSSIVERRPPSGSSRPFGFKPGDI